MIISTPQIAHRHNLQDLNMKIYFDGTQLEQVPIAKILGMYLESLKAIFTVGRPCYTDRKDLQQYFIRFDAIKNFAHF